MDAPKAPDPEKVASAQTGTNVASAIATNNLNNYNQIGPTGTVNYRRAGDMTIRDSNGKRIVIPRYTQITKLSPEQRRIYKLSTANQESLGRLAGSQLDRLDTILNKPIDIMGQLGDRDTDYSADRMRVEDAMFNRLNDQFGEDEAALRSRMAAQGIVPGSAAYNEELETFNDAKNRARTDVLLAGGQEQSRLFGMSEEARRAKLAEILQGRNQPINEITALMSGSQVMMPTALDPMRSDIAPAPIADVYMNNYNQQMDYAKAKMSGLFGLGSSLIGGLFSDELLKEDVERVGSTDEGVPIYTYRYKGTEGPYHMGVMASEIEQVHPEVVGRRSGFKTVDYSRL